MKPFHSTFHKAGVQFVRTKHGGCIDNGVHARLKREFGLLFAGNAGYHWFRKIMGSA